MALPRCAKPLWHKSTYSGGSGNCVEVTNMSTNDITGAKWHKSTHSGENGECVEVAENLREERGVVLVRDTKAKGRGPILLVAPGAWVGFLADAKAGKFDIR